MSDRDALQAARAALGGRSLKITPDTLFGCLETDPRYSPADLREARRVFDSTLIGTAVEFLKKAPPGKAKLRALFRLARAIRPHLSNGQSGWLRFLVALGKQRGESEFQLSYTRRPRSDSARPKATRAKATHTRQAVRDYVVAGAILHRIDAATTNGNTLTIQSAIEAAINDGDIQLQEDMARTAFQRFRRACEELEGTDSYYLTLYEGPIEKYRGRWIAIPSVGPGRLCLPSANGGRPKT